MNKLFKMCEKHFLCSIVLILLCGAQVSEQQNLLSPCPSVFQYQHDGQAWYGVLQVRSPGFGTKLIMNVKMSIAARLPTRYVGRLEMLGDRAEVIQTLLTRGILRYRIHFPLFSPLPTPTIITFNGQVICRGPPAHGSYLTTINLDHSLSAETIGGGTLPQTPQQNQFQPNPGVNEVIQQNTPSNPINLPPGYEIEEYELVSNGNGGYQIVYKDRPNPDTFARPTYIEGTTTTTTTQRPRTRYTTTTTFAPEPPKYTDEEDIFFPNRPDPTTAAPQPPPTQTPQTMNYECGIPFQTNNPLVVNGETVERGEWPWIVAIFTKNINGIEFICGGSLVSQRHVITAAHCIHQKNNRAVKVTEIVLKLGAHNIHDWTDEQTKTAAVSSIELHPTFVAANVLSTDIAVLVMSKPVVYTRYIVPICLWEGNTDQAEIVGRRGAVVGWGRDENGLRATPEPRKTDMPIVSTDTCRASRTEFQLFTNDKTLCAGERNGNGPCNGDSGGGLFMRREGHWVIRGIVSNSLKDPDSFNTCNLHEYIIFTDVAKYNSWLRGLINNTQ